VFEFSSVVAIVVYALVAWAIVRLAALASRRRTTTTYWQLIGADGKDAARSQRFPAAIPFGAPDAGTVLETAGCVTERDFSTTGR
jgi:hypothetical protein